MHIIEYIDYSPNDESHFLDEYHFDNYNDADMYLKLNGFEHTFGNVYKKGDFCGTHAEIKTLTKFDIDLSQLKEHAVKVIEKN